MNLAYILLAHQHPDLVVRLVKRLTSHGSSVVLHYDLNAREKDFEKIQKDLEGHDALVRYADRVHVGWGEWSIIQATLNALQKLSSFSVYPDYVHLVSGADYPIRSEDEFKSFLSKNQGIEFIQAVDITKKQWVTGGLSHERYEYRHPYNWQKNKRLFDWNFKIQKFFKIKRKFPSNFTPHMGSQWWTLTGETCKEILELSKDTSLIKFFTTVWIPDEMYIQTLVAKIVSPQQIANKCLTLYQFNHNGLPLVFTNGHDSYLKKQPFFFARKISPYANKLRDALDNLNIVKKKIDKSLSRQEIGRVSHEYTNFYTNGAIKYQKGRRIIGLVEDQWYGDLKWNDKNYFVLTGDSETELKLVRESLNKLPGIVCHGELFNPDEIQFTENAKTYDGFSASDTRLRDNSKVNFLCQVIRASNENIPIFVLPYGQADDLLEVCLWDDNAKIIHLKSSPLLVYREKSIRVGDIQSKTEKRIIEDEFSSIYEQFNAINYNIENKIKNANSIHWEICLYDIKRNFGYELMEFLFNKTEYANLKDDLSHQLLFLPYQAKYLKLHESSKALQKIILSHVFDKESKYLKKLFQKVDRIQQANYLRKHPHIPEIVVIGGSKKDLLTVESYFKDMKYSNLYIHTPKNDTIKAIDMPSSKKETVVSLLTYNHKNHINQALKYDSILIVFINSDTSLVVKEIELPDTIDQDTKNYLDVSFEDQVNSFRKSLLNSIRKHKNPLLEIEIDKKSKNFQSELKNFLDEHHANSK